MPAQLGKKSSPALPWTPGGGCVPHLGVSGPSGWVGTGEDSWGPPKGKAKGSERQQGRRNAEMGLQQQASCSLAHGRTGSFPNPLLCKCEIPLVQLQFAPSEDCLGTGPSPPRLSWEAHPAPTPSSSSPPTAASGSPGAVVIRPNYSAFVRGHEHQALASQPVPGGCIPAGAAFELGGDARSCCW